MTRSKPADEETPKPGRGRPKILRRPPPTTSDAPLLVPARMINEVLYCERLMYLEWAQQEWDDNFFTVEGRTVHARADAGGAPAPSPDEADENAAPWQARSVWLSSERLGITAKVDVVEGETNGTVVPVEYKRGKRAKVPEGVYPPERAQVAAQILLLRDHGYSCDVGWIWFAGDRQRVVVELDDELERTTLEAVRRARELVRHAEMPPPLEDSPKCRGCSLAGICLPDEMLHLRTRQHEEDVEERAKPAQPLRRLHPALHDREPLYVQEQGARIGISKERIVITSRDGSKTEARLPHTSQVCVMGNVQISTQAIRALLGRGIPVVFFTTGGWFLGRTQVHESKNIELRMAQHAAAADPKFSLELARGFVASKILNSRTMLRRNIPQADEVTLGELKQLARKARETVSAESLLGIEGAAARVYFQSFSGMLKGEAVDAGTFDLESRNRRPPKDPINALLSFAYSLLSKELTVMLASVGLDPLPGFYHRPRFGRPALALDLMEELRPIIADSVVVSAINNGEITDRFFVRAHTGCALDKHGRRRMIRAYERRMSQLVTHPTFGYRISYRRILEVQARLLGRLLLGEIDQYPELRTR